MPLFHFHARADDATRYYHAPYFLAFHNKERRAQAATNMTFHNIFASRQYVRQRHGISSICAQRVDDDADVKMGQPRPNEWDSSLGISARPYQVDSMPIRWLILQAALPTFIIISLKLGDTFTLSFVTGDGYSRCHCIAFLSGQAPHAISLSSPLPSSLRFHKPHTISHTA